MVKYRVGDVLNMRCRDRAINLVAITGFDGFGNALVEWQDKAHHKDSRKCFPQEELRRVSTKLSCSCSC